MQITRTKEGVIGQQWSPNTDLIAFMAGSGDRELYVVRANGAGQKDLGYKVALDDWTSDGKQIMLGINPAGRAPESTSCLLNSATGEL